MNECIMAACKRTGQANYTCSMCDQRNVFCCEGCEIQLLNDLRSIGRVAVVCSKCAVENPVTPRTQTYTAAELVMILKEAEEIREKMIELHMFNDAAVLRNMRTAIKEAYFE